MSDPSQTTGTPVVRLTPPEPAAETDAASAAAGGGTLPRPNHAILLPEPNDDDDLDDLPAGVTRLPTAPRSAVKPRWLSSLTRPAIYIASGIVGGALVTTMYGLFGSRAAPADDRSALDGPRRSVSATGATALDRRADTLSLATEAFTMRARLFDTGRMGCAGLARGLQQVEDAWLAYNVARKEAAASLDSVRDNRDRSLYADVRDVELRFEHSSCTRP